MKKISIFAGNPLVEATGGRIVVADPQIIAFRAALKMAASVRERIHKITIAFDHAGIFGEQFLDPDQSLSIRQRKKLTLSHVHPAIRAPYQSIAAKYGMDLQDISVLTEDYLRLLILQRTDDHRVHRNACRGAACDVQKKAKVNCKGITAAIIEKLTRGSDAAYSYWVHDSLRVQPEVIDEGTELAYELFHIRSKLLQTMIYFPAIIPGNLRAQTIGYQPGPEGNYAQKEVGAYEEFSGG